MFRRPLEIVCIFTFIIFTFPLVGFAQTTSIVNSDTNPKDPNLKLERTVAAQTNDDLNIDFTWEYRPKKSTYKVAEGIEFLFHFVHNIDSDIVLPETIPSHRWHLIDSKSDTKVQNDTQRKTTVTMLLAVDRAGEATLPPLTFKVLDRSGESIELHSKKIDLKFLSILPEDEEPEFKPPRPPVTIWVEDYSIAYIGAASLLAFLFLALFLFMKNRKEIVIIPPPPRAPHDFAIEKLSAIASMDIENATDEEYMLFYVRLSEAIREYIGKIWDFPGTELTTTEIIEHLRDKPFPRELSPDDIGAFLKEIDYVKFAGLRLDNEAGSQLLRQAFTFVEITRNLSLSKHSAALSAFREKYGSNDDIEDKGDADSTQEIKIVDEPATSPKPKEILASETQIESENTTKSEAPMDPTQHENGNQEIEPTNPISTTKEPQ